MMYKCLKCGRVFEQDEVQSWDEKHGFEDGRYERMSGGCPHCGSAFEEVKECDECGEAFFSDELFEGRWCIECLKGMVDCISFLEYCESYKGEFILEDFMVQYVFDMSPANHYSEAFHEAMVREFKQRTNGELRINDELLALVCKYIEEVPDGFAHWLNTRGLEYWHRKVVK